MQKYGLAKDIAIDPDGLVRAPARPWHKYRLRPDRAQKGRVLLPIALSQQPLRPPDPRRGERRKALPAALSRSRLRMTVLLKNRATNP
jgi:hypothetical protein